MGKISKDVGPSIGGGDSPSVGISYTTRSARQRNIVERPKRRSRVTVRTMDNPSPVEETPAESNDTVPTVDGSTPATEEMPLPKKSRRRSSK